MDFGGVSTLRVDTFTVGIYDAWFGYQSYFSATRLAGFLLLFVFLIMFLAKYFGENYSFISMDSEVLNVTSSEGVLNSWTPMEIFGMVPAGATIVQVGVMYTGGADVSSI